VLNESQTRTICTAIRELYPLVLRLKDSDAEELVKYIYISAKKMNHRLREYANLSNDTHDTEERWINQLSVVKGEYEDSLR
jgi:hypothetical protein